MSPSIWIYRSTDLCPINRPPQMPSFGTSVSLSELFADLASRGELIRQLEDHERGLERHGCRRGGWDPSTDWDTRRRRV